jgi:hypothetical protein
MKGLILMFLRKKHSVTGEPEEKKANLFLIISTYIIPPVGMIFYEKNKNLHLKAAKKYRNTVFAGIIVWFSLFWFLGPSGLRFCKDKYFERHIEEYNTITEKTIEQQSQIMCIDGHYYVSSNEKYDDLSCLETAFKTENYSYSQKKEMIDELKFMYKQIRKSAEKNVPELKDGEYLLLFEQGKLETVYFAKETETCVISSESYSGEEPFKLEKKYSTFSDLMNTLGCKKYNIDKLAESGNNKFDYEQIVKDYSK